ncbi:LysR family transcriptional regulator [Myxococcaceae bacterium JPH2]|nr:LysR family transcriptional regulator [Myxococcaceae bacterium JPH2]
MDRLRAFEVFASVVQRGSFTRAADALGTSPANVTRYVNELERHLGTRLLQRTSRRLSLTESGKALYERASAILEEVTEAEALASASTVQVRGRLRLNAPLSFGILHLAPLWPRFLARHPDVELDVSLSDRVVDMVEEGYDLAIRISRGGAGNHIARRLAVSHNRVCAAPAYLARHGMPRHPDDLTAHVCVSYSQSSMAEEWPLTDKAGQTHVARVRSVMQSNNGDTVRAAGLAGLGLIWQPDFLIGEDLRTGRLLHVLPEYALPDIDILAIYPTRRHLTAKVRLMVDFLVEQFKGPLPWGSVSLAD